MWTKQEVEAMWQKGYDEGYREGKRDGSRVHDAALLHAHKTGYAQRKEEESE